MQKLPEACEVPEFDGNNRPFGIRWNPLEFLPMCGGCRHVRELGNKSRCFQRCHSMLRASQDCHHWEHRRGL